MDDKTYLSIEEVVSLPALSELTLSEDGTKIAFVKKTTNWEKDSYQTQIWTYGYGMNKTVMLMDDSTNCLSPKWSPDSKQLAYLKPAGLDRTYKLFIKSFEHQSVMNMTDQTGGIQFFKWAPDGKGVYYVASIKEEKRYVVDEYACLFYLDLESHAVKQLTYKEDFHLKQFTISEDGQMIAFVATPSPNNENDIHGDIYVWNWESKKRKKLNVNKLLGGDICFSPEGKKICYTASKREKDYYRNHINDQSIEIIDLETGESNQPLGNIDSSVTPIRWTETGLLLKWQDKTNDRIGLLTDDGVLETWSKDGCIMGVSTTKDGKASSYLKAENGEIADVYLNNERITTENSIFGERLRSKREVISWRSHDGMEIEGVLSTPVNIQPNRTYPLVVVVHGGPAWASFPIFSDCFNGKYPIESFIEKGFIVLEPNYRGSSGYGDEFLKANYQTLGLAYYDDVLSGVDELIDRGLVNSERVGIMGWSNGGYIAAFCATFGDRFKAVSVGGGITNWRTHYALTDIPFEIRTYFGGPPSEKEKVYTDTSPITYIPLACTPTLIQHGELDARVPSANAYELYRGLKDKGVDTELYLFKGMAYEANEPGLAVMIMEQNLRWFSQYLLDDN
ncbi:S9 family peptidase [Bacillus sp. Marseille-P3800]|uniref:S9 family peptidase n=1 Tax=Bacillus sp. Marseille-P3800 TaxID=2014782 RepID=UPI000C077AB3|nr:S9 family peptidase [Bacillus sp. Marseille-P3800]